MSKLYHKLHCVSLLFLLLLSSTLAWGQSRTVTGTIRSSDDNTPMPGVNIIEKGTSNGSVSDANGNYAIDVDPSATLVFSFVGFITQEVPVGGQTQLDIVLAADATTLSEVVVVGYGTIQKKDLTGAVSQISNKDFNAGINPNPLQAIQGRIAGLNITQPSGDPNQTPTVKLRGYTSLAGGSEPLYVVDGVIGVPINSISPTDIERIDVLKDASASAIYGARAANGVIIVTTKRGRSGRTSVSFNNYVGLETISRRLDMMDADEYREQVRRIKGDASLNDNLKFPTDAQGNGYDTDWIEEITRDAMSNNHDLAISGGSDQLSYRGSINYIKREGIVKNTGFERVTGRINLDQKALNNKLNIQYNLSLTNTQSQLSNNDVINRAILFLPTLPVRDEDGAYYEVPGSFDLFNPVAMLENYQNDDQNRVLIGSINARYEILKGLTLGVNGALKNDNTINGQAYNVAVNAYRGRLGEVSRSYDEGRDKLLELTAQYTKSLGTNSSLVLLGGYSYQDFVNEGFGARNNIGESALDDIRLYELYGYNNIDAYQGTLIRGESSYATSYKTSYKLISFFGRANLNLNDKYNVTATLRRDGSSKFGSNEKWGLFPSLAAGWTLSNEAFLSGSSVLTNLRLRVGWGQTGNSDGIDPYNSIPLYGPGPNYYNPQLDDFLPGLEVVQNANPDLKWEVLSQVNIGLDFELFERFTGTLEVYDKRTQDMLYNYDVPLTGQYFTNNILRNVGEMSNKGIELSFGGDVISAGSFRWTAQLVGAAYTNEIVSLGNEEFNAGTIRYNDFTGRGLGLITASELRAGHPYGEFFIPKFRGFDENGIIQLETEDGGTTTSYAEAARYEAGIAQPRITASFNNSFVFQNFDLSFQLRGVFGNKIINNLRSNIALPGSILENNMLRDVADFPVNYSIPQLSDLWLESGAFVRLDNWQIGYNFPAIGVLQNARLYIGGNNLFIITKYKGIDPELEVKGDLRDDQRTPNSLGMDYSNVYPKTRSFLLGLNLTF